jgi:hypothetical protein
MKARGLLSFHLLYVFHHVENLLSHDTYIIQDLAVKIEGDFFLRYRIFDLFSRTASLVDVPVQAECYGGSFHVYSTKEFPGLQPSTELSKVTTHPFRSKLLLTICRIRSNSLDSV